MAGPSKLDSEGRRDEVIESLKAVIKIYWYTNNTGNIKAIINKHIFLYIAVIRITALFL
jgi:hypothetical protein